MEGHRRRFAEGGPEVSVIIPTHNRARILRATLLRLSAIRLRGPLEVVVVANACSDDTVRMVAEVAEQQGFPIRLVEEPRPSASVARNRGARAAAAPLLVFLDDDILLEPDVLATISEWHEASDKRSLLVGQVLPLAEHLATPFGEFRQRALGGVSPQTHSEDVEWFASGLAAVPAGVFRDMGGYAENYPAAGLEDADLAIRARRSGHRIIFAPAVVGLHNDWAGATARDYCRRVGVHCATAPLLAVQFPDNDHPWRRLIEVNRPASPTDPRSTRVRKRLKQAAVAVAADRWLPDIADRVELPSRAQDLLYRAAISLAMFAGYQRGLDRLAHSDDGSAGPFRTPIEVHTTAHPQGDGPAAQP